MSKFGVGKMRNFRYLNRLLVVTLSLSVFSLAAVIGKSAPAAESAKETVSVLFVVRGDASVEGNALSIKADFVEWFTDRPAHRAGMMSSKELADKWDAGFKSVPPNAAIIGHAADAVVVLSGASIVNGDRVLKYDNIVFGNITTGKIGTVSVFIDPTELCTNETHTEICSPYNPGDGGLAL